MKYAFFLCGSLLACGMAYAGGNVGGGSPPALQDFQIQLMSAEPGTGALFDDGLGDIILLTNRDLQSELTLSNSRLTGADVAITDADFERLRDRNLPIEFVGNLGKNGSYKISAGDRFDILILTDRRAAARAAVTR